MAKGKHSEAEMIGALKQLDGKSIEQLAALLGHTSHKITEKHYNPWVKLRQDRLESDVRDMWKSEKPLVQSFVQSSSVRPN